MSKYSLHGSAAFDERIDSDMQRIVEAIRSDPEGHQVKSIVLLGGYGRGEGTPFKVNQVEMPFNDYDLVVVTNRYSRGFARRMQALEKSLKEQLEIVVDLYPHSPSSLRTAEFSLLNYEMQKGHRVIWGNARALATMPEITLENLPLSEGTRLLMNRGKLLLDIQCRLLDSEPLSREETELFRKFLWKNHLAFGDCALLIKKEYDVLYRVKEARIKRFKDSSEMPEASWMVPVYLRAIAFKQQGELELLNEMELLEEWRRTRKYWLKFFLWFESVRLGVTLETSDGYCEALALKEVRELSSLLRNFRLLGRNMAYPSADWIWLHPRNRLYGALYLLLGGKGNRQSLTHLLGTAGGEAAKIERFYTMRSRLS